MNSGLYWGRWTTLFHQGWMYHTKRSVKGRLHFQCVKYDNGCRGRLKYDSNDGFVVLSEHNHEPARPPPRHRLRHLKAQ